MNPRPWQASTLILIILTLLLWSELRVEVSFNALEKSQSNLPDRQALVAAVNDITKSLSQANFPVTTSSAVVKPAASTQTFKQPNPSDPQPKEYYRVAANVFPAPDKSNPPATNLTAILESSDAQAMQSEMMPKEGTTSPYGLNFSLDTFAVQKKWSQDIAVDPSWKDLYQKIADSTYHPCCGVTISTNDCGHAIALTGLVKKMLSDGKNETEIRSELLLWEKYFFPRHFVIMGLALKKLGQPLDKIDLTPDYSTVQSEKYASDYLIY